MNMLSVKIIRYFAGFSVCIFFLFVVLNCTTTRISAELESASTSLPEYRKGTTFIYSDGSWERVTASTLETVSWTDYRGKVSSGSPDFTYKRDQWRTKTRQGKRTFTTRSDLILKGDQTLWPLRKGNTSRFTETGTWRKEGQPENSYQTEWTCKVIGTERVSVMAGTFDTWKILCKRYNVSKRSKKSRLREEKTWFYAPKAGHYVLTTTKYHYRREPVHLELLAVLPPINDLSEKEIDQMGKRFQRALEFKKSGESEKWSLASKGIVAEIRPTDTFQIPQGTFCRRYEQKIKRPENQKTYFGMACRDPQKGWIVPRQ